MMHERTQLWLVDYVRGRSLAVRHLPMRRHLAHCAECQLTLANLQTALDQPDDEGQMLGPLPAPVDPEQELAQLLDLVEEIPQEALPADVRRHSRHAGLWLALRPAWQYMAAIGALLAVHHARRKRD